MRPCFGIVAGHGRHFVSDIHHRILRGGNEDDLVLFGYVRLNGGAPVLVYEGRSKLAPFLRRWHRPLNPELYQIVPEEHLSDGALLGGARGFVGEADYSGLEALARRAI